MWSRFANSGWYEILVGTLLVIVLALAFYVYGPQLGTGLDNLAGWIDTLSIQGKVLSVAVIGFTLFGLAVTFFGQLTRIER